MVPLEAVVEPQPAAIAAMAASNTAPETSAVILNRLNITDILNQTAGEGKFAGHKQRRRPAGAAIIGPSATARRYAGAAGMKGAS